MLLSLLREPSANGCTIGRLSVDGRFQCYTCEDEVRPPGVKVPGKTAIPAGRYRVIVNRSERFSRSAGREVLLPLLLDVPGFSGVRIHPGNTAADTEGCILPGRGFLTDRVTDSRAAFDALFAAILAAIGAGEQVWIEIAQRQLRVPIPPRAPPPAAQEAKPSTAPPHDLVGDPVGLGWGRRLEPRKRRHPPLAPCLPRFGMAVQAGRVPARHAFDPVLRRYEPAALPGVSAAGAGRKVGHASMFPWRTVKVRATTSGLRSHAPAPCRRFHNSLNSRRGMSG